MKVLATAVAGLALLMAGCDRAPAIEELRGRWDVKSESVKLLKGRLAAPSHSFLLNADGSATYENVPYNLHGTPPGPLLSGPGSWRLAQSSGRTVIVATIQSNGRSYGVEFVPLRTSDGLTLYLDLTDPDQMERFTYFRPAR